MKKVNFSKGVTGRLIGAAAGGAVSAIWDSYVTPVLPASVSAYPDYVKIAAGAVVPMFVKGNQLVNTACDGLMTCGIQNVVADLLANTGTDPTTTTGGTTTGGTTTGGDSVSGLYISGGRRFPSYQKAVRLNGAAKTAVNGAAAKTKKVVYQG